MHFFFLIPMVEIEPKEKQQVQVFSIPFSKIPYAMCLISCTRPYVVVLKSGQRRHLWNSIEARRGKTDFFKNKPNKHRNKKQSQT